MTSFEALALLERMVAADSVPTLDVGELDQLLGLAKRVDSAGLAPSDDNWTATWDLNAAAAEGWRWKAGKVAADFSFSSDSQTFNRSDMVRACMDMARAFGNRVVGSIPYAVVDEWDTDIAGNTNV